MEQYNNTVSDVFLNNDNLNIIFLRKCLKKAFSDLQDITNKIEGLTINIRKNIQTIFNSDIYLIYFFEY